MLESLFSPAAASQDNAYELWREQVNARGGLDVAGGTEAFRKFADGRFVVGEMAYRAVIVPQMQPSTQTLVVMPEKSPTGKAQRVPLRLVTNTLESTGVVPPFVV